MSYDESELFNFLNHKFEEISKMIKNFKSFCTAQNTENDILQ